LDWRGIADTCAQAPGGGGSAVVGLRSNAVDQPIWNGPAASLVFVDAIARVTAAGDRACPIAVLRRVRWDGCGPRTGVFGGALWSSLALVACHLVGSVDLAWLGGGANPAWADIRHHGGVGAGGNVPS